MSRFPKSVSSRHFTTAVGVFMVAILAVGPAPKLGAQQSSQLVTLQALGTTPRLRDFVPSQHAQPNGPSPLMPLRVPPEATKSHGGGGGGGGGTSWTDPVLQSSTSGTPNYTVGGSFDGVPESGYVPSDSNLAVGICNEVNCAGTNSTGQKQIVEVTNVKYAIYTASGVDLLGSPQAMHTIWAPAGSSSMCSTVDGGDPIALFDRIDQRWIISQLAYNSNLNNDHICLAISTSSDATGSYNLYDLQFGANFPDYPKLAVWSDGGSASGSSLNLYKYSALTGGGLSGPVSLTVPTYQEACAGGSCIPQYGTRRQLDSLGDRLMYRLSYLGSTNQMVVNHSVRTSSSSNQTGVRWYVIQSPGGTPTLIYASTFAPGASLYRWMGSIAQDKNGNLGLGYRTSSSSVHPGIAVTGRLKTELNTSGAPVMEPETSILVGPGSQGSINRWGDYTSTAVDPDGCTFWYVDQYITSSASWNTRIGSFRFPTTVCN